MISFTGWARNSITKKEQLAICRKTFRGSRREMQVSDCDCKTLRSDASRTVRHPGDLQPLSETSVNHLPHMSGR
jgi:hypothetical protein